MGRKVEFDYAKVIEKATQLFWKNGYSNTSLRDLLKAMKIGQGSFYNTVKSKKLLYLECLKNYNNTISKRRLEALLAPPSVKEGIRAFFSYVLDELDDPKTPSVCLLAGSLSADVLDEQDLRDYVLTEIDAFMECFCNRLAAAKTAGELPPDFNVQITAQIIITYHLGMSRTIRVMYNRAQIEEQITALLAGLGL